MILNNNNRGVIMELLVSAKNVQWHNPSNHLIPSDPTYGKFVRGKCWSLRRFVLGPSWPLQLVGNCSL